MVAAMATFGFAHKSSPPNTPARQQHHLTALQTHESTAPLPGSSALHLSRSLLAGQAASSRAAEVAVAAADVSGPVSSSILGLGGPVAAAAADAALTEAPQPPQPGRDKVSDRVAGTVVVIRVIFSWSSVFTRQCNQLTRVPQLILPSQGHTVHGLVL
jgi:hypothetical protein